MFKSFWVQGNFLLNICQSQVGDQNEDANVIFEAIDLGFTCVFTCGILVWLRFRAIFFFVRAKTLNWERRDDHGVSGAHCEKSPSAELLVNMFATLPFEFLLDLWNWFDFIVVAVSLISLVSPHVRKFCPLPTFSLHQCLNGVWWHAFLPHQITFTQIHSQMGFTCYNHVSTTHQNRA